MKGDITKKNAIRRNKKRVKQTAEVFTPPRLVNRMLDISFLTKKIWKEDEKNRVL